MSIIYYKKVYFLKHQVIVCGSDGNYEFSPMAQRDGKPIDSKLATKVYHTNSRATTGDYHNGLLPYSLCKYKILFFYFL